MLKFWIDILPGNHVAIKSWIIKANFWHSREYNSNNISVNIYLVNENWLFSLYWCMGVPSVTTDNCHTLSALQTPIFHLVRLLKLSCNFIEKGIHICKNMNRDFFGAHKSGKFFLYVACIHHNILLIMICLIYEYFSPPEITLFSGLPSTSCQLC